MITQINSSGMNDMAIAVVSVVMAFVLVAMYVGIKPQNCKVNHILSILPSLVAGGLIAYGVAFPMFYVALLTEEQIGLAQFTLYFGTCVTGLCVASGVWLICRHEN